MVRSEIIQTLKEFKEQYGDARIKLINSFYNRLR